MNDLFASGTHITRSKHMSWLRTAILRIFHSTLPSCRKSCSKAQLNIAHYITSHHITSAGYSTHMTGKWDAGMTTWDHVPTSRGFDTYLGYYASETDCLRWCAHFGQMSVTFDDFKFNLLLTAYFSYTLNRLHAQRIWSWLQWHWLSKWHVAAPHTARCGMYCLDWGRQRNPTHHFKSQESTPRSSSRMRSCDWQLPCRRCAAVYVFANKLSVSVIWISIKI